MAEAEFNRDVFFMKQIKVDSKEEMEVFQVKFRHVQWIVLELLCAMLYSFVVFLLEIISWFQKVLSNIVEGLGLSRVYVIW